MKHSNFIHSIDELFPKKTRPLEKWYLLFWKNNEILFTGRVFLIVMIYLEKCVFLLHNWSLIHSRKSTEQVDIPLETGLLIDSFSSLHFITLQQYFCSFSWELSSHHARGVPPQARCFFCVASSPTMSAFSFGTTSTRVQSQVSPICLLPHLFRLFPENFRE